MEFGFSAAEQAFADEVRGFLRDNPLDGFVLDGMDAGYGSGAHSRAFMKALAERGFISMCWPESFGGRAAPMFFKLVLFEELALAGAPFGPLAGSWQTADAIIEYGSERLRRDVLPAVARGEATFWQGYSEPDAGSDLLALKTEARRDGDHYVIRGHKIWSSHAGIATHGLVFTRTSREARRSRGFSMFVVPNGTPGMDIRPIRSLTGGVYHYEVFLDDVRVPADLMLGPEGEGFQALLNGLDSDRFWGRFYKAPALERVLREPRRRPPAAAGGDGRGARGAAPALLPRSVPAARRRADRLRDGRRQGLRGRDRTEARAARHGPARPVGTAARGLARGAAGRRDLPRVPHQPRPHDRRRHRGGPAHERRRTGPRTARRAEESLTA
jgi:hypothetical protein